MGVIQLSERAAWRIVRDDYSPGAAVSPPSAQCRYNAAMLHALKLHSDSICEAVTGLSAFVTRRAAQLVVRYVVHGNIAAVRIPSALAARRGDELWQHTCCEAFLRAADLSAHGDGYYEFNFSPTTEWAAYRFSGYRARMVNAEISAPTITMARNAEHLELQATIDCESLALSDKKWRLGIAAVIEEMNGRKSYWALAHPPGNPDFHHADGFVIELES
jgi:hypothetical protein